jgi:Family of unknown function (DUF5677)
MHVNGVGKPSSRATSLPSARRSRVLPLPGMPSTTTGSVAPASHQARSSLSSGRGTHEGPTSDQGSIENDSDALARADGRTSGSITISITRPDGQPVFRLPRADRTAYLETMDFDYDEWLSELIQEGLEQLLSKLTPEQLAELEDNAEAIASNAVAKAIDGAAKGMVETLKADAPAMLAHRKSGQAEFERRLAEHWAEAFALSEMVMKVAHEIGEFFYEKHCPPNGVHDYVFEALGRLLARACRIAEEVLVLLKAGYGQGALARWRALHEVAIVADFIAENGDECAERYFTHEGVESWRAMQEYQEHAAALGQEPYSEEEVESARQQYEALLERYGRRFAGAYGWAQEAVAAKDARYAKRDVTFSALEAGVGTPHMRPYYRMASHGVHANPKGVMWAPDLLPADRGLVLLTGPSPAGLADPGHSTLISLTRVTATTLASKRGEATGPSRHGPASAHRRGRRRIPAGSQEAGGGRDGGWHGL